MKYLFATVGKLVILKWNFHVRLRLIKGTGARGRACAGSETSNLSVLTT